MYKIFLCIRYLTRKGIVIFPILAVWLCVAMLIVVNSIMTGFVDRVRSTGRSLEGDVIVSAQAMGGFPYYQELQQKINQLPQVAASAPEINSYGLLNLPEYEISMGVQIVGIDPALESKVSSFDQSLFWQYQAPRQAAEDLEGVRFPTTQPALVQYAAGLVSRALDEVNRREKAVNDLKPIPADAWFAGIRAHWQEITREDAQQAQAELEQAENNFDFVQQLPTSDVFAHEADLTRALVSAAPTFAPPPEAADFYPTTQAAPENGCIVGVDLGFYDRDRFGNYHRPPGFRFTPVILTVVPVTMRATLATPQTGQFMIVDDSHTQVFTVDSKTVYAPFDVVQKLAFMQQQDRLDGSIQAARASAIQVLVKNNSDPQAIAAGRSAISSLVDQFDSEHPDASIAGIRVQTWDQVQADYIHAVDNERNLIMFILGLMSLVVIVVIFLIFFMIVRDKTQDIGIIKAIGGSESGVAAIFILYGVIISTIGSLLGTITGVLFVLNDNWIHDNVLWRVFGITIWDRSVYIFSEIPHRVDSQMTAVIVGSAILAGLIGAAIPAFIAARQDPVESLRYE